MQPLEEASKYFLKQGIPFPKIHLSEEEKKNLKECYIFEDADIPEAPTVVFFPLVNDTFKKYKEPGKPWTQTVLPPPGHPLAVSEWEAWSSMVLSLPYHCPHGREMLVCA